jgi:NADH dehydrogenase
MAERTADVKPVCDCWLTFVIVGGGPTGVELAGAIRELAKYTLQRNFRAIDPARARVLLVQSGNRLLPAFHEKLSENALKALKKMGVEVRLHSRVTHIEAHKVGIKGPDGDEEVEASNVIWAAGVQASPLASKLAQASGAALDKSGRVAVQPDLSLPGYPEVFAVGDMAQIPWKEGQTVPGVAPAAMQSGAHAGKVIMAQLAGKERPAFVYFDKGSMATIGRAQAVAEAKGLRLTGFTGWMAWLFVHIMYLARFENRVLVLWQWFWNYLTRNRAARLITGEVPRNLAIDSLEQGMNEVVPPEKKAMMAEMMAKPKPQSAAAS